MVTANVNLTIFFPVLLICFVLLKKFFFHKNKRGNGLNYKGKGYKAKVTCYVHLQQYMIKSISFLCFTAITLNKGIC